MDTCKLYTNFTDFLEPQDELTESIVVSSPHSTMSLSELRRPTKNVALLNNKSPSLSELRHPTKNAVPSNNKSPSLSEMKQESKQTPKRPLVTSAWLIQNMLSSSLKQEFLPVNLNHSRHLRRGKGASSSTEHEGSRVESRPIRPERTRLKHTKQLRTNQTHQNLKHTHHLQQEESQENPLGATHPLKSQAKVNRKLFTEDGKERKANEFENMFDSTPESRCRSFLPYLTSQTKSRREIAISELWHALPLSKYPGPNLTYPFVVNELCPALSQILRNFLENGRVGDNSVEEGLQDGSDSQEYWISSSRLLMVLDICTCISNPDYSFIAELSLLIPHLIPAGDHFQVAHAAIAVDVHDGLRWLTGKSREEGFLQRRCAMDGMDEDDNRALEAILAQPCIRSM